MKKLLMIIFIVNLLVLSLCGCSNDETDINANQEVKPQQNNEKTTSSTNTSTKAYSKNDSAKKKEDQNPEPECKTIDSIEQWEHPVKTSFEELDYWFGDLVKVELYQEETYPVFYVEITHYLTFLEKLNRYDFNDHLSEIARTNGYWDYEIRDIEDRLCIKVVCDKKDKAVNQYEINGYTDLKDFLLAVRDKDFNDYLSTLTLDDTNNLIECKGDVDGDGLEEGLMIFNEAIYLVQCTENQEYRNLGRLMDDYVVGHEYIGLDIRSLDKSDKEYIVIDISHDAAPATGYFIYDYDGYLPELIFLDFPGATAYGTRLLIDYDKDGIEDHVQYDDYIDVQQHRVITYSSFESGDEYIELHYMNPKGEFFYPSEPENVVQSYIESSCLVNEAESECDMFLTKPELKDINLDYSANTITYMEIELDINRVKDNENEVILDVKEETHYGEIYSMRFYLKKTDDRWKIDNIEALTN